MRTKRGRGVGPSAPVASKPVTVKRPIVRETAFYGDPNDPKSAVRKPMPTKSKGGRTRRRSRRRRSTSSR